MSRNVAVFAVDRISASRSKIAARQDQTIKLFYRISLEVDRFQSYKEADNGTVILCPIKERP